jgi:hypothetical protein
MNMRGNTLRRGRMLEKAHFKSSSINSKERK